LDENILESSEFIENCNNAIKFDALEEFTNEVFSCIPPSNQSIHPNKHQIFHTINTNIEQSKDNNNSRLILNLFEQIQETQKEQEKLEEHELDNIDNTLENVE